MQREKPITVLMAVFNTEELFLRESIESILHQSFSDFEFIIVLDSPTDNSAEIIKEYKEKDNRIIIIENEMNLGLTKSLNIGIDLAQGKYIARMDADDVAFPERFAKQFEYMESHPDTVVLGTRTYTPGTDKTSQDTCIPDQEVLKIRMMFGNPGVPHPTAFIRRSVLTKNNLRYNENVKKSQDYRLWADIINYGKIEMLPLVLLMYRVHDNQISTGDPHRKDTYSLRISCDVVSNLIGELSESDIELVRTMRIGELPDNNVKRLENFCDRIISSNQYKHLYNERILERELRYIWSLKALRRVKQYGETDLIWNKWFSLYKPSIIKYYTYNRSIHNNYLNMVKKLSQ